MPCRRRPNTCSRASGELVQAPGPERPGPPARCCWPRTDRTARSSLILEGDDAPLGPAAAVALALVVHESATNAVKYGALADAARTGDDPLHAKQRHARSTWQERGGPPAPEAPGHRGFGTEMVTRSVSGQLGGTIEYGWSRDGLTIRVTAPHGEPRPLNRGPAGRGRVVLQDSARRRRLRPDADGTRLAYGK